MVSDHSPSTADLKRHDTGRLRRRLGRHRLAPARAARGVDRGPPRAVTRSPTWSAGCPTGPARLAGLAGKGAVAEGRDADFAVLAPEETFTVDPAQLHHRNPITAYAGRTLHGVVRATWLRGTRIAEHGAVADEPVGRLIERPADGS